MKLEVKKDGYSMMGKCNCSRINTSQCGINYRMGNA